MKGTGSKRRMSQKVVNSFFISLDCHCRIVKFLSFLYIRLSCENFFVYLCSSYLFPNTYTCTPTKLTSEHKSKEYNTQKTLQNCVTVYSVFVFVTWFSKIWKSRIDVEKSFARKTSRRKYVDFLSVYHWISIGHWILISSLLHDILRDVY